MIQQTSLLAWNKIKGQLSHKQEEVLDCIRSFKRPVTNAEISNRLNWPINRVTPRVLELRLLMKVGLQDKGKCPITRNTAGFWGII